MNIDDSLKLVSQLLDLPIIDKEERWCGIVDDVSLEGSPGKTMRIKALLVGPGAYAGRMPKWAFWFVRKIAGDRIVQVSADEIIEVGAVVKLKSSAEDLKLGHTEDKVRAWIPRMGAL